MSDIALINRHFTELNPMTVGEEACAPGHQFGPAVRDYTLIHFIVRGTGYFSSGGTTYTLHPGEAFLIRPGEITVYHADLQDPWHYQWVGFDGTLSERFSNLPPVFSYSKNWVEEMLQAYEADGVGEYRIAGLLFGMYAELFAVEKPQNHYVRRVQNYVNTLYMQPLRVEEIADTMSLDRRYLSRLFKERVGMTVQEYLIHVRMEAAKKHLSKGASVAEAAQLCGYEDVCNFSKMFKRLFGISPAQWKKSL
ncbi:MAG: AraC family transcriptional regulator [Clostridia bacterium]|nr:AraC family transcriptional regulator [Clostridia bacterium]